MLYIPLIGATGFNTAAVAWIIQILVHLNF